MVDQTLEECVNAPAPGFRCSAAGAKSDMRFLAKVHHILHPPASANSIDRIRRVTGLHAESIAAFYVRHNGFILYCDSLSDAAGIELFPVEQWDEETQDMRDTFAHLADDLENDPDCILTGVALATVPHSGNYFVMPVEGPSAGKIFYADHDGWYESAFANDFAEFLQRVVRDPVKLLAEDVGCYTRYSDGRTKLQWIPEEYFPDISKAEI